MGCVLRRNVLEFNPFEIELNHARSRRRCTSSFTTWGYKTIQVALYFFISLRFHQCTIFAHCVCSGLEIVGFLFIFAGDCRFAWQTQTIKEIYWASFSRAQMTSLSLSPTTYCVLFCFEKTRPTKFFWLDKPKLKLPKKFVVWFGEVYTFI